MLFIRLLSPQHLPVQAQNAAIAHPLRRGTPTQCNTQQRSRITLARLNNRTHRKLLVVDGLVGFAGGVGIAPKWTCAGQDVAHWRDSHFRVEGPVVAQMQSTFLDNRLKVTGEVLHDGVYFPAISRASKSSAQIFSSSPSSG